MEFFTKIKILILCACLGALMVAHFRKKSPRPLVAPHRQAPLFQIPHDQITKTILKNGMTVLTYKTPSIPKVLVQIAYNVGSSVEGSGQRGLAHLIEHMIFKGTNQLAEGDIDAIARKYGATYNAFTSADITSYYFETNKNNWEPFVQILADCMQNARFDSEHLASEIRAVIQELKMGKDNHWRIMFLKACEIAFPPNHPYHTPVIGYKEDLLNLSADNLKRFYQSHYSPQKATLLFVGDIDPERALDLATQYFEPINGTTETPDPHFPKIYPELITHHVKMYEDVSKDLIMVYWTTPGFKDNHELVSSALQAILGRGRDSRLRRLLIDEKKVATSISVKAHKFLHAGLFCIFIEPCKGKISDCQQLIRNELSSIIQKGVTPAELLRTHKYKSRKFYQKLESPSAITSQWIRTFFATGDELDLFARINRYHEISPKQIQTFVKTYLDPFLMNTIQVVPLPQEKRDHRVALKNRADAFDASILKKYTRQTPLEEPTFVHKLPKPQLIEFDFPHPDQLYTLANGLTVMLYATSTSPLIHLNLAFKDAFDREQTMNALTKNLMMHMLVEGTKNHTKKEIVSFFENLGARYNFSSRGAELLTLKNDIEIAAQEFVTILTNPAFPTAGLEKLKNTYTTALQRNKDSARAVAFELLRNSLYQQHPYQWTTDQAIATIKKMTCQRLSLLHKKEINPTNMVLAVVGDFEQEAIKGIIKRTFGHLPKGHAVKTSFPDPSFTPQETIDSYMLRDQTILLFGQPCPVTVHDKDFLPLKLLNTAGFSSLGSRLFGLRERTGLFYTAFGGFAARSSNVPGISYVGALLSGDDLEQAEKLIRAMIDELGEKGITQEELDGTRQLYAKKMVDRVAKNAAIANTFCYLASMKLPFDYYDKTLKRLSSMTLEQINDVAARAIDSQDMVRIRVGRLPKNDEGKKLS